jgi:hypothetical protein
METDRKQLIRLLRAFHDDSPCTFDHRGDCQAHGFFGFEPGELCPQAELTVVLAKEDSHG